MEILSLLRVFVCAIGVKFVLHDLCIDHMMSIAMYEKLIIWDFYFLNSEMWILKLFCIMVPLSYRYQASTSLGM